MQVSYSSTEPTLQPVQPNSLSQNNLVIGNTLIGLLIILFPSCIILGIVLYKKHCAYRAAVLLQQIEALERLWRISPRK
jgi:hypothetical protein